MKKFYTILFALLFFPFAALADQVVSATITNVEADSTGRFFIYFSPAMTGGPSCATGTTVLVFDGTTSAGATLEGIALSAFALGKTVTMAGTGTCTIYAGYENLSYIETTD